MSDRQIIEYNEQATRAGQKRRTLYVGCFDCASGIPHLSHSPTKATRGLAEMKKELSDAEAREKSLYAQFREAAIRHASAESEFEEEMRNLEEEFVAAGEDEIALEVAEYRIAEAQDNHAWSERNCQWEEAWIMSEMRRESQRAAELRDEIKTERQYLFDEMSKDDGASWDEENNQTD